MLIYISLKIALQIYDGRSSTWRYLACSHPLHSLISGTSMFFFNFIYKKVLNFNVYRRDYQLEWNAFCMTIGHLCVFLCVWTDCSYCLWLVDRRFTGSRWISHLRLTCSKNREDRQSEYLVEICIIIQESGGTMIWPPKSSPVCSQLWVMRLSQWGLDFLEAGLFPPDSAVHKVDWNDCVSV